MAILLIWHIHLISNSLCGTKQANSLVMTQAIVTAPGDEDGWMVKSSSGKRPHYVKMSKCAFACDDQCLSYKSMKLCSHTIALAIKTDSVRNLLRWYRSRKCTPNFTVLSEAGKPKSTGKSARKCVLKKTSKEISTIVREAEMSSAEWEYHGDAVEPSECALDTASQGDTASSLAAAYPGTQVPLQQPLTL